MLRKTLLYNTLLNKIIQVPDKIVIRWGMIFPVLILMCISFITLKYTSVNSSFFSSTFIKQIVWFGMGSVVFILKANCLVWNGKRCFYSGTVDTNPIFSRICLSLLWYSNYSNWDNLFHACDWGIAQMDNIWPSLFSAFGNWEITIGLCNCQGSYR